MERIPMKRKNVYLTEEHLDFFANRKDIPIAEHLRRALDDYIQKIAPMNAATSPSKTFYSKLQRIKKESYAK